MKKFILYYFLFLCLTGFSRNLSNPFMVGPISTYTEQLFITGNIIEEQSKVKFVSSTNESDILHLGFDIFKSRNYYAHPSFSNINLESPLKLGGKQNYWIGKPDEPKNGFSQPKQHPFKVWQLTAYSAQIYARANYGQNETKEGSVTTSKASQGYLSGGLALHTRSFFVHPNFMDVNLSGSYAPETKRNYAVGMPDYTEKNDLEEINLSIQFFKKQPFILTTSGGYSIGNSNFDYISRVKYKSKYIGAGFSYPNKILPFTLSYNYNNLEQKIVESNRLFGTNQQLFQATTGKSFTQYDNTSIAYDHSLFNSYQNDITGGNSYSGHIYYDQLNINNSINFFLDKKKNYSYSSNINSLNALGNIKINNLTLFENFTMRLPKNFVWTNTYNYGIIKQNLYGQGSVKNYNQAFQTSLRHQLFKSLSTQIMYGYGENKSNHVFRQERNTIGFNAAYSKVIPYGYFILNYAYNKEFQKISTPSTTLNIVHERYLLLDGTTTLLDNQHVDIASIVVTDVTGTIVYVLGTDYLLINNDPVIEIVRLPGGIIANNSNVYIDYTAVKPGKYKYTSNSHVLFANFLLFKNKLSLSYTFSKQDFNDITSSSDVQVLNYYIRHKIAARLDFVFIKAGVEYDYNKSTINPYAGMFYYVNYQKIYKRISITANADLSDMQMLDQTQRRQNINLTGKLAYAVKRNIFVNGDYSYRKMTGRGIDLDLQVAKLSVTGNFRKLYLSVGADFYLSSYFSTKTSYKGTYIQLSRNF